MNMRALLSTEPGGPETLALADLPTPTPAAGEVLVAVKACGVNFFDALIIEDLYQYRPQRPFAPGSEIAGVVTAVGDGVQLLKVGDRVLGNIYWGGMAEAVAVKALDLVRIPDAMAYDVAAGFMVTYGTSYHALRDRARMRRGQSLLILGAAGGVGLAAVELGKAMGARVIAAASSQEKVDLCIAHGADTGVVYGRGPFDREGQKDLAQLFKTAVGAGGADVIYDAIGGDYAEPALRSIAWEGKYLVVGFAAGDIPKIPLNLALLKGCDIAGVFWGDWVTRNPQGHQQAAAELLALHAAGKIAPLVSERFPLAQGGAAIARLASRQAMGKVVVTLD
jgi:NADPH2:quinone reductase